MQPSQLDKNHPRVEVFNAEQLKEIEKTCAEYMKSIAWLDADAFQSLGQDVALVPENFDLDSIESDKDGVSVTVDGFVTILTLDTEFLTKLILSIIFQEFGFDPQTAEPDMMDDETQTQFLKTGYPHVVIGYNDNAWILRYKPEEEPV